MLFMPYPCLLVAKKCLPLHIYIPRQNNLIASVTAKNDAH